MKKEEHPFATNPEKAAARVAINGVMLASLFVMLAVVFLEPEKFNQWSIAQMLFSIPLLFISCLSYAKIGYWKNIKPWNALGYFTNTFGNLFMINAIGLLAARLSYSISYYYFGLTVLLLLIYSSISITHTKSVRMKLFSLIFSLAIIFVGGILPLLWHII